MNESNLLFSAVGKHYAARKKLGVLLVDSSRMIIRSTPLANNLLGGGCLGIREGSIVCQDPKDDRALEQLFHQAHQQELHSEQNGVQFSQQVLGSCDFIELLVGRTSANPLLISVISVAVEQACVDAGQRFVVVLCCPKQTEAEDINRLKNIFGLTEREAQLALHLSTGGRLAAFSEQRHLAMNTVKTHLKQVFKKVGANSQLGAAVTLVKALH